MIRYALAIAMFIPWVAYAASYGVKGTKPAITIAHDRMLLIHGKRTFVLGLYEDPKEDAVLDQVATAGFNLIRASENAEALDRLQNHGLYGWLNTGARIDLSREEGARSSQLREMAEKYGPHPALLVWEVPDEALWNCWYAPYCWRADKERAQLRQRLAALEDRALAKQLEAQLNESIALFDAGEYQGSEAIANGIWRSLGEEVPAGPQYDLSAAAKNAATLCAGMRKGYQLLKKLDPNHPIWMNHAPRNQKVQLAAFGKAADIVGCDIYPVPEYRGGHSDLADRSLSSTGAYTTIMQQSAPRKPVWMVLQGFGWADIGTSEIRDGKEVFRRPTFDESRFMAYDAIVRGARGILYWGTAYIEKDSELWLNLMRLIRELASLQAVLSAPDAKLNLRITYAEGLSSIDRGIRVLPKHVDGKMWFLIVNEEPSLLTYTLHRLESVEGVSYADFVTGRRASVSHGALCLTIPGHGVQVLAPEDWTSGKERRPKQ